MEKTIDCRGLECPLPVVNTKKESEAFTEDGMLHIRVDNETAVSNLLKFAAQHGYEAASTKNDEKDYCVTMNVKVGDDAAEEGCPVFAPEKIGVVIGSNRMGCGKEELGKLLIKSFIFALTSQDKVPDYIIFYNSGAYLTCEGSDSLDDLKALADAGAAIMTCGTCLNFYGIQDKLQVGIVSNMYDIVETQLKCTKLIRP